MNGIEREHGLSQLASRGYVLSPALHRSEDRSFAYIPLDFQSRDQRNASSNRKLTHELLLHRVDV